MRTGSLEIRETFFARGFPRISRVQDGDVNKKNGNVNKQYDNPPKNEIMEIIKIWNIHFVCPGHFSVNYANQYKVSRLVSLSIHSPHSKESMKDTVWNTVIWWVR